MDGDKRWVMAALQDCARKFLDAKHALTAKVHGPLPSEKGSRPFNIQCVNFLRADIAGKHY
jgi:hypothetical protein